MPDRRREALAVYAHQAWAAYMTYHLEQGRLNKDGSITLSPEYVKALRRQAGLSFTELTVREQDLDRQEADKILLIAGSGV